MNEAKIWLVIIVGCIILTPVVGYCLREYDFKRQISGKKPERKVKQNKKILSENESMNLNEEMTKAK